MDDLTQPHDRLFKALMSHPDTVGDLLREYLPTELAALLTPTPPQFVEGSFVDEELRGYFSDRLFVVDTRGDKALHIYVLIEHKSYPEQKVGWQVVRGIFTFLDQKARERADWTLLPGVVPMIFYHGAKAWRIPSAFLALIDADPAFHPWLINARFVTVNLGKVAGARIAHSARLRAGLLALKYGTRDPEAQLAALEVIVSALVEAPELLIPIVLYLLTTFPELDREAVRGIVVRVCPREETEMMSRFAREIVEENKQAMSQFAREIVEQNKQVWWKEGRQEGRQEGIQIGEQRSHKKGTAALLMRQLRQRFGSLPEWVEERIAAADAADIELWGDRVLTAQSLEEVFGK
ncbi:MAG: Rpn family recombination-promoting nuclease/putative transposase [Magnetococcales bacterium]|nr:Rpn family recombination-promoting nuclease/putative transposase [Magnetococcales bacterium]